jgi:hypothetical protein
MLRQYPEVLPHEMDQGFPFHDCSVSLKHDVIVRRSTWKATGAVFALRPSFVRPYRMGRTEAVEQARSLRQWGVPCAALASFCGRDALCW